MIFFVFIQHDVHNNPKLGIVLSAYNPELRKLRQKESEFQVGLDINVDKFYFLTINSIPYMAVFPSDHFLRGRYLDNFQFRTFINKLPISFAVEIFIRI